MTSTSVKIGDQTVVLSTSAFLPVKYRQLFNKDLFAQLSKLSTIRAALAKYQSAIQVVLAKQQGTEKTSDTDTAEAAAETEAEDAPSDAAAETEAEDTSRDAAAETEAEAEAEADDEDTPSDAEADDEDTPSDAEADDEADEIGAVDEAALSLLSGIDIVFFAELEYTMVVLAGGAQGGKQSMEDWFATLPDAGAVYTLMWPALELYIKDSNVTSRPKKKGKKRKDE